MTKETMNIGCGSSSSIDRMDVALPVVNALIAAGKPAALFFEMLAEQLLARANLDRMKDPQKGYVPELGGFFRPVLKRCIENGVPIISHGGAANPMGAARYLHELAKELGIKGLRVAVVDGDDIRADLRGMWTDQFSYEKPIDLQNTEILSANVYLGSEWIANALDLEPHIVITGRVTDTALVLGPLMHQFGWKAGDWDKLAAGILAGHLVECGAQVTGGYFADPGLKDVSGLANVGFPIAEVEEDGSSFVITKPDGTGGVVNKRTVKEQMIYEIHDPTNFLSPDVILDISEVELHQLGPDRVRVSGAKGKAMPDTLKVLVGMDGGWLGEGEISYAGPNALARAKMSAEIMRERVDMLHLDCDLRIDLIGTGSIHDGDSGELSKSYNGEPEEVRVRVAANAKDEETAALVARHVINLCCNGPAGGAGARELTTQRIKIGSVLVKRHDIKPRVTMMEENDV